MSAVRRHSRPAGAALVLLTVLITSAALAHAENPTPGGSVPGTLSLELSEPSPFHRLRSEGRGSVFASAIRVRATATDAPSELSISDGEAAAGMRRGHLVSRSSALAQPLLVASRGHFSSLAVPVLPLRGWRRPITVAPATIHLRQGALAARALRTHHKLLLITLSAPSP